MTHPNPDQAGKPDNIPTAIAALVNQLNIPYRPPATLPEICPCCRQATGSYWVIPHNWRAP